MVAPLVYLYHRLGTCLSPSWYMFVTELVYVCHRVGVCLSLSWYIFVTDFVHGCHRVSTFFAWYIFVTDLVYVCHRLSICLSPTWYMFVTDLVYVCVTDLVYVCVTELVYVCHRLCLSLSPTLHCLTKKNSCYRLIESRCHRVGLSPSYANTLHIVCTSLVYKLCHTTTPCFSSLSCLCVSPPCLRTWHI